MGNGAANRKSLVVSAGVYAEVRPEVSSGAALASSISLPLLGLLLVLVITGGGPPI